jgi:predicted DNA-binding transcriptional regulator YafY
MRASRLLAILLALQARGRVTAEALAAEFEVSARTIYRDIDALSMAGVPVYGDKGHGGGFSLVDGYRTRLTGLSDGEAEALWLAGLPGPAAAMGMGAAASVAGAKLLAALLVKATARADRIGGRFHLDPVDWYRAAEAVPHLPALVRAVLDERVVAMRYEGWSGTHDWRVEPLGVVLKAGGWYLVANGRGKARTFRVAAVMSLVVEDAAFERPPGFDLAAHWLASQADFEARLRPLTTRVRASEEGRRRIARLGAYAAVAVAGADEEVDLPVESVDQAALLLLGLGPEVEALDPDVRARLHALASAVAARSFPQAPAAAIGLP